MSAAYNESAMVKPSKPHAPIADSDRLHSIPETCATLGIGPTKCWELINQGRLAVVRLGSRCTRIKKSSIDRLIQNGVSGLKEAQ
jgi:predicted DNA-binding transcriptional regulator AlpA